MDDAEQMPSARERYEVALEDFKQAAQRHRQAVFRRDRDLADYEADLEEKRRAYEAVRTEVG